MTTVYVDTSVFGGCYDDEFSEYSFKLLNEFKRGVKKMMVSDVVYYELQGASENIRLQAFKVPFLFMTITKASQKAYSLARKYISEGVLGVESRLDALHVATASLQGADMIASWNFKHMVNAGKIDLFNAINNHMGYRTIKIRSPREILNQ